MSRVRTPAEVIADAIAYRRAERACGGLAEHYIPPSRAIRGMLLRDAEVVLRHLQQEGFVVVSKGQSIGGRA